MKVQTVGEREAIKTIKGAALILPEVIKRVMFKFSLNHLLQGLDSHYHLAIFSDTLLLTVRITTNCGKFFKRCEYQTILPAS